jgi:Zn ribbon nucleic-acid-binding protein
MTELAFDKAVANHVCIVCGEQDFMDVGENNGDIVVSCKCGFNNVYSYEADIIE